MTRIRERTVKGTPTYGGGRTKVTVKTNGAHPWVCVYECYPEGGERFIGSIDGLTNLRRLRDAIDSMLPPKRVKKVSPPTELSQGAKHA